jgi:hypothetical protein
MKSKNKKIDDGRRLFISRPPLIITMSAPAPKMSHTQLLDSIIQKKSKIALPFLHELLSLNDPIIRKQKASQMCSAWATVRAVSWGAGFGFGFAHRRINPANSQSSQRITCVFGEFFGSWEKYSDKGYNYALKYSEARKTTKNGIEILHAQPNTLSYIFEASDKTTAAELKEACKKNGLKPTGSKKTLIQKLMKL